MKIYKFSRDKIENLKLNIIQYFRKRKEKKIEQEKEIKYIYEDVELVIGDCGSGKSVYLVSQAMKYLKMGFPVYSTTPIQNCKIITINDLMRYDLEENAIIIFDEGASMGLGARGELARKNSSSNVVEFFTMNRHYKVRKVIIASPSFSDVIPVVRSRVKNVTVTKSPFFVNLLLFPFNLVMKILKKDKIKVTLLRYIGKTICLPNSDIMSKSAEPTETFFWLSAFNRKYVLQNKYYKYFNTYSCKELPKKSWSIW